MFAGKYGPRPWPLLGGLSLRGVRQAQPKDQLAPRRAAGGPELCIAVSPSQLHQARRGSQMHREQPADVPPHGRQHRGWEGSVHHSATNTEVRVAGHWPASWQRVQAELSTPVQSQDQGRCCGMGIVGWALWGGHSRVGTVRQAQWSEHGRAAGDAREVLCAHQPAHQLLRQRGHSPTVDAVLLTSCA